VLVLPGTAGRVAVDVRVKIRVRGFGCYHDHFRAR
jgi:hypothetical protein